MTSTPLNIVFFFLILITFTFIFSTLQPTPTPTHLDHTDEPLTQTNHLDDTSTKHLFWFIQISDIHISHVHDPTRITSFQTFCDQIINLIKPKTVLASGDLTDGKKKNFADSDQFISEWQVYEKTIRDNFDINSTVWLDIRGNHDNFNVLSRNKPSNLFQRYSIKKAFSRSYMHEVRTDSGDRYTFIGIDACTEPGAKRPYNFFGNLEENDLQILESYSEKSKDSNGTVWFGHYPITTIHSERKLVDVMKNGAVYLCGHLHNFIGLINKMYARHASGMLELELADWKDNRVFRLMAFDAGLFSFRDIYTGHKNGRYISQKSIFTLITNPKDILAKTRREPSLRPLQSTHIRLLIFSKNPNVTAHIFLDETLIGEATRVNGDDQPPLYTIPWNPETYSQGVHTIRALVTDAKGNIDQTGFEFALDDSLKSFGYFASLLLVNNQIVFLRNLYYLCTTYILLTLFYFRITRRHHSPSLLTCNTVRLPTQVYFRRLALLCSINSVFYYLVFTTLYTAIGPWFLGRILDDHLGLCFIWGIYVNGLFLKEDIQYMVAIFHIILFQIPLILQLSYQTEQRFTNLAAPKVDWKTVKLQGIIRFCLGQIWKNALLIVVCFFNVITLIEYYQAYSLIAVLVCPFKFWNLCLGLYFWYKCDRLETNDFNLFMEKTVNKKDSDLLLKEF